VASSAVIFTLGRCDSDTHCEFADLIRRSAAYVDKILKGAWPGDLPVQQPTKFELVINRRAASARGLAIPQALLGRPDRIIE